MKAFLMLILCSVWLVAPSHASTPYPQHSLYYLPDTFTNQDGVTHRLDLHRGHPVLITMFYGSCPMTCPLLIQAVHNIEQSLSAAQRKELRVILVSVDPENDTPQTLANLARERRIDTSRWTLARADERTVRRLAALLGIQYRRLPAGGYNHSSVLTVLGPTGVIEARSNSIGAVDSVLTNAITKTVKAMSLPLRHIDSTVDRLER